MKNKKKKKRTIYNRVRALEIDKIHESGSKCLADCSITI